MTDTHYGFHGTKGRKWVGEVNRLCSVQKVGPDCLLISTRDQEYRLFHVKRCDCVVRFLSALVPKEVEETHCEDVIRNQLAGFSDTPLLDVKLPMALGMGGGVTHRLERLNTRFVQSASFYRSLLLSGGDFGIQVGQWKEIDGKRCCPEMRRDVQFQHVYTVLRKEIPCLERRKR